MVPGFFRNLGLLSVAQLVARARGLILLPILSRYLGTTEFGTWAQVSVIVFTLSPLISLGTENGIIRLLPGLDAAAQRARYTAWLLCIVGAAAVAASGAALARDWVATLFFGASDEFRLYVPLAAASLFATMLIVAGNAWFVIRSDGVVMAGTVVAQAAIGLVAVLIAIASRGDVFAVVACGVAADLAVGLGLLALLAARGVLRRPDFAVLGPTIRFGLPLVPAGYALWGMNWLDRIFLVHYRSLAEIGIYSAAYALGLAVNQICFSPFWAVYPNAAAALYNKGDHDGLDRLLHTTIGAALAITLPAIAGLWALGTPIMALVAGPAYQSGAAIAAIIALAYFFSMLASFANVSLGLAFRQHHGAAAVIAAALVNVALNFLLIPPLGILGAGLATMAAFFCQFVIAWGLALRSGPFWRGGLYPAKLVLAAAGMGIAVAWLDGVVAGGLALHVILLTATGAMIYLALVLLLGAAPAAITAPMRARIASFARSLTP